MYTIKLSRVRLGDGPRKRRKSKKKKKKKKKRVLEAFRRRGFGTALVSRWIKEFAIDAKAFAVDMPNGKMLKLLKHARCEVAVEKSGFEAGTLHFLNLPI
ncbi:unnamed protein product [Bathycoccus prasinos]